MLNLDFRFVACVASLLGPASHILLWMRLDVDSSSHQLLVLANLAVLLPPIALYLRGAAFLDAVLITWTADICYAVSLLASIFLYRAFFHPLRSYPGPFWARISVFWKVKHYQASNFQAYKVIDDLHHAYGDIVRLGPRQLSISEPSAYQAIYGASSECHRLSHLEQIRKNLQSLADPAEHHTRRKVWDHGLNAKACQSYLPRINDITNRLCARFAEFNGKPITVNDWCHFYTFDIMGDLGFGRSYGQIESGKAHPAITKVQNFLKAGVIALQMLWIVNFLQLIPGLDDPMRDLKEWAEALLKERDERTTEKEREENRDLMSYVEESRRVVDERWPMTDKDIAEDAVTLQVAGSDTSYSVLVNLCHYLANYPELQEKIRKEILGTFDGGDGSNGPTWSRLASAQQCPFLDATVNEVLRRHAPVPMGTMRETPDHPMEIAGQVIPAKTILSCPIWTMQYDERCFKDANKFIPERWLDGSHPESRADLMLDKRGFVPFSMGGMNCAGRYFAYMEIKVFVAKMLRKFEIAFPDTQLVEEKDGYQAKLARDQQLVNGTKDYLTQWASEVEVCFIPLGEQ